jgi:serine/threonine protein kinase
LQCLNESPGRHSGVIQELAVLKYKDKFNLLLPLADFTLEKLQIQIDISTHSLSDLLGQVANVADALSWLHTSIRTADDTAVRACHMDLNPSNILIFQDGASTPVGVWKIADFSTSTLTLDTGQELLPPPKLVPLTYSAPEIQQPIESNRASPESDVWSLGCILFEVLLGFVDGQEKAMEWRDKWNNMPRFLDEGCDGPVLSSRVQEWLDGNHADIMVISCKHLILDVLKLLPMERLTAAELSQSLTSVVQIS